MRLNFTTNHLLFFALSGCLFLLSFSSCGKRNEIKWIYYDETRCADKWQSDINNERLKDNVMNYMDSQGVHIYDMEIFTDRTPDQCSDCSCKTGRRYKAKIKGRDLSDAKSEGFYE